MDQAARSLLRFSLWTLAFYAGLGLALEGLHGFKIAWYLSAATTMRRELLTLGHAHGTLFSIAGIGVACSWPFFDSRLQARVRAATAMVRFATIATPFGFLLGGAFAQGGDPGLAILLVPMGALAFIAGITQLARSVARA